MDRSEAMQALRAEMEREPRETRCSACTKLYASAEELLRAWQANAERRTDVDDVRRLRAKIQAVCELTGIADPATWSPARRAGRSS